MNANLSKRQTTLAPPESVTIEGINLNSMSDYCVRFHNNDVTTFDQVSACFRSACHYSEQDAEAYTYAINSKGSVIAYWGGQEQCQTVVKAFANIGVKCDILKNT